jgi:hypothetical protein
MKHPLIEMSEPEVAGLALPLRALWYAAQGDWDKAHQLVQDDPSADCAWVHAYLHRAEGDIGNAHYWYQRARKPAATNSLDDELQALIGAFSK